MLSGWSVRPVPPPDATEKYLLKQQLAQDKHDCEAALR